MASQLRADRRFVTGKVSIVGPAVWCRRQKRRSRAGYSDISRDHMVYTLCALLDESVMNQEPPMMAT